MTLPAFPEADITLARYAATLTLNDEKYKQDVEISARLRDRSIQIMKEENEESDDCAMEEGTAWGSTAISVKPKPTTQTQTSTTQTSTSTITQTSTSSTRTTSTSSTRTTSTRTTTTRPCGCFEMCCEAEPVQGVHLPVVPNVCPEWWQGKMTGRAFEANTSGLPSSLDGSLKTKKSQKPGEAECVGCDIGASGAGPSERVFFQSPSERNFFQKWSRADAGVASAGRNPWEAIGVVLASVAMVQGVVILRWHSRRNVHVEGADSHAGVLQRLVQREESVD